MNLKPIVVMLAALSAIPSAQAQFTHWIEGSLTTQSPTYNRPNSNLQGMSEDGVGVFYDTYAFTVTASGSYWFWTDSVGYNGVFFLYQNGFDPTHPQVGALVGEEEGYGAELDLVTGQTYIAVNTSFAAAEVGAFRFYISSYDGFDVEVVPEPAAFGLMVLGLGPIFLARRRRQVVT